MSEPLHHTVFQAEMDRPHRLIDVTRGCFSELFTKNTLHISEDKIPYDMFEKDYITAVIQPHHHHVYLVKKWKPGMTSEMDETTCMLIEV